MIGRPRWGPHEATFLGWLRLREALGVAAREPAMLQHTWRILADDPARPATLGSCSGRCFQAAVKAMRAQGRLEPTKEVHLEPPNAPGAVEAAWRLLPAFHGRWSELWDLQTLLQAAGPGPWPADRGIEALRTHDDEVDASAGHQPRRTGKRRGPAAERLHALHDRGWLEGPRDAARMAPAARNSLTLLHLVLRPELRIPASSLERIGTVRPSRN